MTPQTTCDEQAMLEQRRETEYILNQAEEQGKRPIRKMDTLAARQIIEEKQNGARNKTIADKLKISVRHVQRICRWFKGIELGQMLYFPKRPGRHSNTLWNAGPYKAGRLGMDDNVRERLAQIHHGVRHI